MIPAALLTAGRWLISSQLGHYLCGLLVAAGVATGFAVHFENKGAAKLEAKQEVLADAKVHKADAAAKAIDRKPDEALDDRYRRD